MVFVIEAYYPKKSLSVAINRGFIRLDGNVLAII
jgi:hypothetical protein